MLPEPWTSSPARGKVRLAIHQPFYVFLSDSTAYGTSHAEMGNKLISVATTDSHPPLGNAFRKIGRVWHTMADIDQAESTSECVILGDSLGYQGLNARSAKETLQQRTAVLEEYQAAVKVAISKRRNIERLKASSNIRPERVDEALEELDEVYTRARPLRDLGLMNFTG